jgi:uncharacterized protein YcbK (DUF882 family)
MHKGVEKSLRGHMRKQLSVAKVNECVCRRASTPHRKSRPACREHLRDFLRSRRTSNLLTLVQLFRSRFACAFAACGCELAAGCTSVGLALAAFVVFGSAASAGSGEEKHPTKANAVPIGAPVERTIALKHLWTGEALNIVYKIGDVYQPDAMEKINNLLRDWRCKKTTAIDPRLIDVLYDLHQAVGGRGSIRVISGYRSEGYNASLLLAGRTVDPESQHMQGRAVDIVIPGVRGNALREAAVKLRVGGVGYYPYSWRSFVHVDTGPIRQWIEVDPNERRALHLQTPQRTRIHLDCSLTIASVFEKISRENAKAALPSGASADISSLNDSKIVHTCDTHELVHLAVLGRPKVASSVHRLPKKVRHRITHHKRHIRRHR